MHSVFTIFLSRQYVNWVLVFTLSIGIFLKREVWVLLLLFGFFFFFCKFKVVGITYFYHPLFFRVVLGAQPEEAMAPHSGTLAWKIPWVEEPGRLQSMGSWRVGQDWATSLSLFTFMHWRRKWQPTSVFLPGESQERGSLVGCHLWGRTESDTTEVT